VARSLECSLSVLICSSVRCCMPLLYHCWRGYASG